MRYWYVYVIKCASGKLYIGSPNDLERRFEEHRTGQGGHFTFYDKAKEQIYSEKYETRLEAETREKQLKKWGRAKKEALIKGDFIKLKLLSKRRKAATALSSNGRT